MGIEVGRVQQEAKCMGGKTERPSDLKAMERLQSGKMKTRPEQKQQESATAGLEGRWHPLFRSRSRSSK